MKRRILLSTLFALLLAGCDDDDELTDGGGQDDAAAELDAGADAESGSDAEVTPDAEGLPDAGDEPDVGDEPEPEPAMTLPLAPLDEPLLRLEPAISGEETRDLREDFDWAATEPWPEVDPDGRPALRYALVYISSRDHLETLDLAEIHHWSLPLFPEERERWAGEKGVYSPVGDGLGYFEFAILPAGAFNVLRAAALEGDVRFEAIVPREAPAEYTHPDGSLRYDALLRGGFRYDPVLPSSAPPDLGGGQAPFIELIVAAVLALSRDARDAVEDAAGEVDREFRDTIFVNFRVDLRNTDPAFNPMMGPAAPMLRGWASRVDGFRRGEQLPLEGVGLVAGVGLGHHRVTLDARGQGRLEIGVNAEYTVCLRMANHAAYISEMWESIQVCDFDSGRLLVNLPDDADVDLAVADWRLNILAQMTDSWRYAAERLGHRPRRPARVLVGFLADIFGAFNQNRAFALCGGWFGLQGVEFEAILAGIPAIIAVLPIPPDWMIAANILVQSFARIALGYDVIFPGGGGEDHATSRGVPTHEYGHFFTCELSEAIDHWSWSESWADVVNTSLFVQQGVGTENLWVIEGIADWFTSQVVGGVNYFDPPNSELSLSVEYCQPGVVCMDENLGGPDNPAAALFGDRVGMVATLLHDAFDGRAGFVDDTTGPGAAWRPGMGTEPRLVLAEDLTEPGGPRDEAIAAPSQAFQRLFRRWAERSNSWNLANLVRALVSMLRDEGYSDPQICVLLGLHVPSGMCDEMPGHGIDILDIPPARPIFVSTPDRPRDRATWVWRDVSVVASGYVTEFGVEGGELDLDIVAPYTREAEFTAEGLEPDTVYRFQVHTIIGDQSSPRAVDRTITRAEPAGEPTLTPFAGGLEVDWVEVAASGYEVEIVRRTEPFCAVDGDCADGPCLRNGCAGVGAEVARQRRPVEAPPLRLEGLDPTEIYEVRIISFNQAGVPEDPSPPAFAVPLAPEAIHVDPANGDDDNSGEARAPVASLDAAIERARAGASVIRLARGEFRVDGGVVLPAGVGLEGGYIPGAWRREGGRSVLRIENGAPANVTRCAVFNPGGRATFAAVQTEGDALRVRDIELLLAIRPERPAETCVVGFDASAADLELESVRVISTEYGAPAGQRCFAGAQASGGVVQLQDVDLSSVYTLVGPEGVRAVGLCALNAASLNIADSTLIGYDQPNWRGGFTPVAVAGLDASDVGVARITRSVIRATTSGTANGGDTHGARILARDRVFIDNAVITSSTGGRWSRALTVGAADAELGSARLYHLAVSAGGDARLVTENARGHEGAALRLEGAIDDVELYNSVLIHAAGRLPLGQPGLMALVDRRAAEDPRRLTMRGTVGSVVDRIPYLVCPEEAGEFSGIVSPVAWEGAPFNHRCFQDTVVAAWRTDANVGFNNTAGREGVVLDALGRVADVAGGRSARVDVGVQVDAAVWPEVQRDIQGELHERADPMAGAWR